MSSPGHVQFQEPSSILGMKDGGSEWEFWLHLALIKNHFTYEPHASHDLRESLALNTYQLRKKGTLEFPLGRKQRKPDSSLRTITSINNSECLLVLKRESKFIALQGSITSIYGFQIWLRYWILMGLDCSVNASQGVLVCDTATT